MKRQVVCKVGSSNYFSRFKLFAAISNKLLLSRWPSLRNIIVSLPIVVSFANCSVLANYYCVVGNCSVDAKYCCLVGHCCVIANYCCVVANYCCVVCQLFCPIVVSLPIVLSLRIVVSLSIVPIVLSLPIVVSLPIIVMPLRIIVVSLAIVVSLLVHLSLYNWLVSLVRFIVTCCTATYHLLYVDTQSTLRLVL